MKASFLIIILVISNISALTQVISNIRFEQEGKMINIYYDLTGDGEYEVKVFCSQDGGSTWGSTLSQVSGAVGKEQNEGANKKITWDVLSETNNLDGKISFKIELIQEELLEDPRAIHKGSSTEQGSPYGISGIPNYEGTGGAGDGISYSLGGRGAMMLHKPSYDSKEQGKVVVTIRVDRQGNVISASPGAKGTNVSDKKLWDVAKDAALRSRFAADPNALETQTGTITYNFIRQN